MSNIKPLPIIIGVIGLFLAVILFPCPGPSRERARSASCLSNIKQISLSLLVYADDYDGKLPPFDKWNDITGKKRMLVCPSTESHKLPSYALNADLETVSLHDIKNPDKVVFVFESKPGRNRIGGPEILPLKPRHDGVVNIGFLDGHAIRVKNVKGMYSKWEDLPYPMQKSSPEQR